MWCLYNLMNSCVASQETQRERIAFVSLRKAETGAEAFLRGKNQG